jgi:hypothetical protein
MAYNNNQQTKKISYPLATFFSSEKKGNEYQFVKLGFYDGKLTFNFMKGTSGGGGEGGDAYVSLEYEAACLLKQMVDKIIQHRVGLFRNGQVYDDIYLTYTISFTDKDSHEQRIAGTLTLRTSEATPEKPSNIMQFVYSNGTNTFTIALGNAYLTKAFTHTDELFGDLDKGDGRLYAFAYLLHNIIRSWPILQQNDKIATVVMNRLQAVSEKLGISQETSGQGQGGKYNEKYRSNPSARDMDAQEDVPF